MSCGCARGSKEKRPQLDRMRTECRRRRVDAVVVYRYDRFARSFRQLVNALCEFDALGIQFVSLYEGVDTSTPNGRLVFGIFASTWASWRIRLEAIQRPPNAGIRQDLPRAARS